MVLSHIAHGGNMNLKKNIIYHLHVPNDVNKVIDVCH